MKHLLRFTATTVLIWETVLLFNQANEALIICGF